MTDSTNTWRNQSLSSNGDIDLQDMKFDFEDYFKRHGTEAMSDEEAKEFGARVMGVFCRDFFNSDGDPSKVEPWVANYIAKAFYNVLGGIPWAQALPTPFDEAEDQEIYTPKGRRALGFYCAIQNTIKSHPNRLLKYWFAHRQPRTSTA